MAIHELDLELPALRRDKDRRPLGGPLQRVVTAGLIAVPCVSVLGP
jgi:hypothetical protein